jgi:hypothetical protein
MNPDANFVRPRMTLINRVYCLSVYIRQIRVICGYF